MNLKNAGMRLGATSIGVAISLTVFAAHEKAATDPIDAIDAMVSSIVLQQVGDMGGARHPECEIAGDVAVLFAPGTPRSQIEQVMQNVRRARENEYQTYYQINNRWSTVARGNTGSRGNPITLGYSFPADGVFIPSGGLGSGPNVLNQRFDAQFGNRNTWRSLFDQSFARWAVLSGLSFVLEPDDNAALHSSAGVVGVRGDVRIAGFGMTNNNVLAYNYFPNNGDMVMNTNWNFANPPSNNYRFLRNTVMHEHGHGMGLAHVDPLNGTKLMEAALNTNFDGPQDDDIQGAQRNYGDTLENDDTAATAYNIGTVSNGQQVSDISLDDRLDVDWFRVVVPGGNSLTTTIVPVGSTYSQGPQGGQTQQRSSHMILNLRLSIYRANGTTLLGQADANGLGGSEVVSGIVPHPDDNGVVLVRVDTTSSTQDIQRYRMVFNLAQAYSDYFAQTATTTRGQYVSGTVDDLLTSNNVYYVIEQRPPFILTDPYAELTMTTTVGGNPVSALTFTYEANTNGLPTSNMRIRTELFDFQANQWVLVDERQPSNSDVTVNIQPSNPSRFKSGSNEMRARLRWYDLGTVTATWVVRTDFVRWRVTQ
ncbi:MAG: matrixin family metalloprotease [Candidatus Nitrosotenuis sp.]